ncbi:unnamed protein product [Clonostachys rosea]|uniref:Uncharacterized protein n=1 Tax=Bionectria ochroleuca TaxID=29856 RepID=A0ABY6U840_BIOOC|nr:unnamed protein product [Clonostachys rosea]
MAGFDGASRNCLLLGTQALIQGIAASSSTPNRASIITQIQLFENMSYFPDARLLGCHSNCISLIGELANTLQNGSKTFVIGHPPTRA